MKSEGEMLPYFYFFCYLDKIRYMIFLKKLWIKGEFRENWCSENQTSVKSEGEMLPYFYFFCDLDKIQYMIF